MFGVCYCCKGLILFGYDYIGYGEKFEVLKFVLVVMEQIGSYVCMIFVKIWFVGIDDKVIECDLFGFWEYFCFDVVIGDVYGVGMLISLNDQLFVWNFVDIDCYVVNDGQSNVSVWD